MTASRGYLTAAVVGIVLAGALRGEEVPLRFADDFSTDSRKEYQIKGDVGWEKGRLLLPPKAEVRRLAELGRHTQLRATITVPAAKEVRTVFFGAGGAWSTLSVGLRWQEGKVSLVWPTPKPEVVPVSATGKPAAAERWQVRLDLDHGLLQAKVWPDGQEEPRDWQLVRGREDLTPWEPNWVRVAAEDGATELGSWEVRSSRRERWTAEQTRQLDEAERCVLEVVRLTQLGNDSGAEAKAREAVRIHRTILPPDHFVLARSLLFQGISQYRLGKFGDARPLLEESAKIVRKALPPDHPLRVNCLGHLGMLLHAMGKFSEARTLLEEISRSDRRVLPPDHPYLATSLNHLGALLMDMGKYAEAQPLIEESLKIRRKVLPPDHPDLGRGVNNLGAVLTFMGKYAEAQPLLEEALKIRRKALPPDHPDIAQSAMNLGYLLRRMDKDAEARPLLAEALGILRKRLPPEHPDLARALVNLGMLLKKMGNSGEARPLLEEAVKINRKALPPEHPDLAESLGIMGELRLETGQLRLAFTLQHDAVQSWANHIRTTVVSSAQGDHTAIIVQRRVHLDTFLSLTALTLAPDDPRWSDVLQAVLDSKSVSATALSTRREGILASNDPEAERLLRQLRPRQQELADLLLRGRGKLSPAEYRDHCIQLRQECDDLERRLGTLSRAYAEERHARRATPADLAKRLPVDGACVEFLSYFRKDFKARRLDSRRYLALVLRPGDKEGDAPQIGFVDLGKVADMDAAIDAWRVAVRKGRTDGTAERRLRELLWEPLARVLPEKTTRLFLAPDGRLALLPFEALHLDDGRFLIERYHVSYLNSGRDLLPRPQPPAKPDAAVMLADPDYDAISDDASLRKPDAVAADLPRDLVFGGAPARRLPGFAREADAAAKLLEGHKGYRIVPLRAAAATEEALQKAGRARLLYCITHGFFLPDVPRPAPDKLFRELGLVGEAPHQRRLPELGPDPRLRSGLVLAGANQWQERVKKGLSDGLLTALEVEQLDLWGTELVILSACDTGRGEVQIGEGVLGLRRAFQLAGAECVLASLWPVEDRPTELLLQDFLRRWLDGKPPATALREAQLAAIAELRKSKNKHLAEAPPVLWAGFICHGARPEKR
jgi:CHAT domain-containing protein/tetratricopeptide (TPR) repeat protein